MSRSFASGQSGFSLAEVLVSMSIMLIVLGGTFQVMASSMRDAHTAKQVTSLNYNLRTSMDVMVRDMLQVGQGLPSGSRITVPNGAGATLINRPGPAASGACPGAIRFPAGAFIPAVTSGPGLGPPVGTRCTDVITMLAVDATFEGVVVTTAANGSTATVTDPLVDISGGGDGPANDLRVGDLLIIRSGTASALMHITAVDGNQTVTFGAGDSLNLNQFGAGVLGTILQLPAGPRRAARIRMVTYYVDTLTDPQHPRLVRRIGGGPPNAVGFEVEMLRFTFDITDSVGNPTGVRLLPADFAAGGACGANPCSPNQIRIVNILLAMRSRNRRTATDDYFRNTLSTQVSARSLAFFDQYR